MSKKTSHAHRPSGPKLVPSPGRESKKIVGEPTIVVDSPPSAVVSSSSPVSSEAKTSEPKGTTVTITATRINPDRKGSSLVFKLANGYTLKGPASAFGPDVAPDASFDIEAPEGLFSTGRGTPKAKMTKEERAALKAAETPEQKVAAAKLRAQKAIARAAKLEKELASAGA